MSKLWISIRKRPINAWLIIIVLSLYLFNNNCLKSISEGIAREFFICYFNDLICPLFFLSYCNIFLLTAGRELRGLVAILMLMLSAGIIWEFLAPVIKDGSVTDPIDLICYLVGGGVYWIILNINMSRKVH